MKKSEVHKIAENIEIEYNNSDTYENYIDNIAYKNAASIFIFDKNSNMIYSSNNSSGQGNVTQMPTRPVTIDTSEFVEKIQSSPTKRVNYTLKIDKFKSEYLANTHFYYFYQPVIFLHPAFGNNLFASSAVIYLVFIIDFILAGILALASIYPFEDL